VDPSRVFWEGQSLGGILGTINVAANPRISEAVLNVPGGTFADIAVTSPAFAPALTAVLGSLSPPIVAGTPQFLQFVQVAKWVLDPAEPINFAGHLLGGIDHPTLPNLLAGGAPQTAKNVLGQLAVCDDVVPNPFNLLLFNVAGVQQGQANRYQIFKSTTTPQVLTGDCLLPPPFDTGAVAHGFLLDHGFTAAAAGAAFVPARNAANHAALSAIARLDAASFLADPATPLNDTEAQ
jgi:hypothetical protein